MAITIGYTDSPSTVDLFEIDRYKKGLIQFIKTCNTPITIAIQGDWGSGKTSLMSMIDQELEKDANIQRIWFNTWQYSQFNKSDDLAVSLLSAIGNKIKVKDLESRTMFDRYCDTLSSGVGKLVKTGVKVGAAVAGGLSGAGADTGIKAVEAAMNIGRGENNIAVVLENLKASFENIVANACGKDGRVVFFIDDLDRLVPAKAVELLEVLKIFLDSPHCVFVLAIDYGVVQRGVADKYGSDFDKEKAKYFFDKIIQVPFKMPVADYNIDRFVNKCFTDIGISVSNIEEYIELINLSIGNNPRSMKRLFNSYLLLLSIAQENLTKSAESKQLLFALLCLQSRFDKIYDYLIGHKDDLDPEFIKAIREKDNHLFDELKLSKKEADSFHDFADAFIKLIDKDNSGTVTAEELKPFLEVLSFSAITANGTDTNERKRIPPKLVKGVDELVLEYDEKGKREKIQHIVDVVQEYTGCIPQFKQYRNYFNIVYRIKEELRLDITLFERKNGLCLEVCGDKDFLSNSVSVANFVQNHNLKCNNYGNRKYFQYRVGYDYTKDLAEIEPMIKKLCDEIS